MGGETERPENTEMTHKGTVREFDENYENDTDAPGDMESLVQDVLVCAADAVNDIADEVYQNDDRMRDAFLSRLDWSLRNVGVNEGLAATDGPNKAVQHTLTRAFECVDRESKGVRIALLPVDREVFAEVGNDPTAYQTRFEQALRAARAEEDVSLESPPEIMSLRPRDLKTVPGTVWYEVVRNVENKQENPCAPLASYVAPSAKQEADDDTVFLLPFVISDVWSGASFDETIDKALPQELARAWRVDGQKIGRPVNPSEALECLPEELMGHVVNLDPAIFRRLAPASAGNLAEAEHEDPTNDDNRLREDAEALQRRVRRAIVTDPHDGRIDDLLTELSHDADTRAYRAVMDAINRERLSVQLADGCESSRYVMVAIVTGWYQLPPMLNTDAVVSQFVRPLLADTDPLAVDKATGDPFVISADNLRKKGVTGQKELVAELTLGHENPSSLPESEVVLDQQSVENTSDGHVLVYCVPVRLNALRTDLQNADLSLQMSVAPMLVTRPMIGQKIVDGMYDIGQRLQVIGVVRRTAQKTDAFSIETQFLSSRTLVVGAYDTHGELVERVDLSTNNALQVIELLSLMAKQQGFTFFDSMRKA